MYTHFSFAFLKDAIGDNTLKSIKLSMLLPDSGFISICFRQDLFKNSVAEFSPWKGKKRPLVLLMVLFFMNWVGWDRVQEKLLQEIWLNDRKK
jgi:hypothetical protein